MSLSLAFAQIQRQSWYGEALGDGDRNVAAKRRSEENRQCILNIIKRADAPIPMKQIADMTGLTLYSVRNLVKPSIAAGMVERVTIDGIIHLEWAR